MKNKVILLLTIFSGLAIKASDEIPSSRGRIKLGHKVYPKKEIFFFVDIEIEYMDDSIFTKTVNDVEHLVILLNKLSIQRRIEYQENLENRMDEHSAADLYVGLFDTLKMFRKWSLGHKKMIPAIVQDNDTYVLLNNREEIRKFWEDHKDNNKDKQIDDYDLDAEYYNELFFLK